MVICSVRTSLTLCLAAALTSARPAPLHAQASHVVDSAAIAGSGARTLAELLAARVPGLSVTWLSGNPSDAPYVSARGVSGASGSGRPYLYIDGVLQVDDEYTLFLEVERQKPEHHWLLPVDEIQSVEVVLGASGGAALELGSARGAVLVTTRRPEQGAWRSRVFAESWMVGGGPAFRPSTTTVGSLSPSGSTSYCTLASQVGGGCTPTGTRRTNPFGGSQPFQSAIGARAGLSATGSAIGVAARVGAAVEAAPGALGDRSDRVDLALALERRVTRRIRASADIRLAGTFADQYPYALLRQIGHTARYLDEPDPGPQYDPDAEYPGRYEGWRTNARGTIGIALGRRDSIELGAHVDRLSRDIHLGEHFFTGEPVIASLDRVAYTGSARYVVSRGLPQRLMPSFVMGAFLRDDKTEERLFGSGRWVRRPALLAQYLQFSLASRERRQFSLGVRREASVDSDAPWVDDTPLKFASFRWTLSDEPRLASLRRYGRSTLSLRYGESSDIQATDDAFGRSFETGTFLGVSRERVIERDISFETLLPGRRVRVNASLFDRRVSGGHLRVPLSSGSGFSDGLRPGIATEARGAEFAIAYTRPVAEASTLDLRAWGAYASTRFGELGIPSGFSSLYYAGGPSTKYRSGGVVGAIAGGRPEFVDLNGDGVIVLSEVSYGEIPGARVNPTVTLGLAMTLRAGARWSFGATVDGKGGHHRFDQVSYLKCIARVCSAMYDPDTPLQEQAIAAGFEVPVRPAAFVRLRELTVRRHFSRTGTTVSLIAQNALTWAQFSGDDPEASTVAAPGVFAGDNFQQPISPRLSLRVEFGEPRPR